MLAAPELGSLWVIRPGTSFFGFPPDSVFLVIDHWHDGHRDVSAVIVYSGQSMTPARRTDVSHYWFDSAHLMRL